MQSVKPILLSLLYLTVLSAREPFLMDVPTYDELPDSLYTESIYIQTSNAIEVSIDCQPGEHIKQGTTTCIPGDITDPPGIFLPNCAEGARLVQGTNECIVTQSADPFNTYLPECPSGYQHIQGTSQCIERQITIVHNNAAGGNRSDVGNDITVDDSGDIYVTGYSLSSDRTFEMVIWKYKSNGREDRSFDWDGIAVHHRGQHDYGVGITLDGSGNIYVTGHGEYATIDMVIWKYKSDGSLDTSFDRDGIVVHNNAAGGNLHDYGKDIAVDDSGNIYVTGYSRNINNDNVMVIWKYTSDGTLDPSFGSNGIVTHRGAAGGYNLDYGYGITLDGSGNIYVGGTSYNYEGNADMVIWKYKSDGTLDTSFDSDGIVVNHNAAGGNGNDGAFGITLDGSGNIYLTGDSLNSNGDTDIVIWKYKSDGTLDTSFASNGIAVNHNAAGGDSDDYARGITLDSSGNIYVTGSSINRSGYIDMVIWKYKSDGTLDTSFYGDGIDTQHSSAGVLGNDWGLGIAANGSDNICVSGQGTSATSTDMVLWIYK